MSDPTAPGEIVAPDGYYITTHDKLADGQAYRTPGQTSPDSRRHTFGNTGDRTLVFAKRIERTVTVTLTETDARAFMRGYRLAPAIEAFRAALAELDGDQ